MRGLLGLMCGAMLVFATNSVTLASLATSSPSPPLPPIITSIDVLNSFVIRVSWAPVISTPSTSAYALEYKQSSEERWTRLPSEERWTRLPSEERWTRLPSSPLCSRTLGNLLPATSYNLRVSAANAMGEGIPSPIYTVKTLARVPTAPEITDIIPLSPKEVLIKWNPPTGQHEVILQYVISYSSAHQQEVPFRRTAAGHVTMATISGLDPAVQYTFNISTISKGAGPQAILLRREREGSTPSNSTDFPVVAVAVGASVGGVATLLILALIVGLSIKFCCCKKRQSVDFVRTSSVRSSMTKKRVVDPTDEFRAQNKTDALENHPPLPVVNFLDRLNVMKMNDNQLFLEEFGAIPMTAPHPCEASEMQENKDKNRFNNIPAYDYNRVKLQDGLNSDYINANHCDGYLAKNVYIATQGPLPDTVADFWQMVWEADAHTIVMLTNVQEKGKPKCAIYWPPSPGASVTHGNIEVTLTNVTQLADYTTRAFVITKIGFGKMEPHDVTQFHFTSWPDHGVPQYATAMLAMCRRVRTYHPKRGPIVVHCSAGVGRTGTYMAIDTMGERLKNGEATVDIFGYVSLLRNQRNFMVQTEDQYFFIHEAVAEAILCGQTEVKVHDLATYMEELHKPNNDTTRIDVEFKRLLIDKTDPYRFASALKDVNKQKNRFVNALPYETNRVYLEYIRATEGSDYINASYVDSYRRQKAFIATQGPLARTVMDFWRMIRQYKCPVIIMLTELVEKGQERSALYWPRETGDPRQFGNLTLELTKQRPSPTYTHRELTLTNTETGQRHEIHHFQYHGWPEQGVPLSGHDFIHFIQEVRNFYSALNVTYPMVVHCNNGVGRTGVFIAMHIILERMLVEGHVDVFQTVKSLRIQRPAMVQTVEQYAFCYDVALDFVESSGLLQQPLPTEQRLRGNSNAGELKRKNPSRSSISVPRGDMYTRRSSVRLAPSTSLLHSREDQCEMSSILSVPAETGTSFVTDNPSTPDTCRLSSVPEVVIVSEDGSKQGSAPDMGMGETTRLLSPPPTTLALDFNPNSSEA